MSKERKYYISEIRKRKGLTQLDCAKHYNVSLTTYNTWEKNFGSIPCSKAKEIVDFLSDGALTLDDIYF